MKYFVALMYNELYNNMVLTSGVAEKENRISQIFVVTELYTFMYNILLFWEYNETCEIRMITYKIENYFLY